MNFALHGANPENLYKVFGLPVPPKIMDFSTNTNAVEWHGKIAGAIEDVLPAYPDTDSRALRKELARQNNCSEENILITNGSNEAIYIIASYNAHKKNAILQPVYGEYSRALYAYGGKPSNIFSLSEVLAGGYECAWFCNPCNPTGAYVSEDVCASLVCGNPECTFMIDEAYADFLLPEPKKFRTIYKNVILLRSLTKIFHLCGARIGYVIADEACIAELKKRQPSWSVNELAQRAALAFLADKEFYRRTREYYCTEMPRFIGALQDAGWETMPTSVNFLLVKTDNDEALIRYLLTKNIAVRHTRNFPSLDGAYIRVAARTKAENEAFLLAMREYRERVGGK